jgi:hypothetical protein
LQPGWKSEKESKRRAVVQRCSNQAALCELALHDPSELVRAAAQPMRAIGKKLDEAGGFALKLQAHELFAVNSFGVGLARNLEMVWGGIDGWRGNIAAVWVGM